jgi:drug/metabolite transporter (DMT)-like permease
VQFGNRRVSAGAGAALASALAFGVSTPASKMLLAGTDLYLGAGVGLWLLRMVRRSPTVRLARGEASWFAGAVICGGLLAPLLLLNGLAALPASGSSLLLNAESVLTALIAWIVFHENLDARVALGMLAIAAGAVVLSWPSGPAEFGRLWPSLLVVAACALWALDNNLTRRVSATDATWLAMMKGLVAGSINLSIALGRGAVLPQPTTLAGALAVGFVCYGLSLSLFVVGLRNLGTARTGAYFAVAPFVGAILSVLALAEPVTWRLAVGGILMGFGVWLHLSERHIHEHTHERLVHAHPHPHVHEPITHIHPHYPDIHHRHSHGDQGTP